MQLGKNSFGRSSFAGHHLPITRYLLLLPANLVFCLLHPVSVIFPNYSLKYSEPHQNICLTAREGTLKPYVRSTLTVKTFREPTDILLIVYPTIGVRYKI